MDELRWDERPTDLKSPVMVAAFGGWNDAAAAASGAVVFVGERLGASRVAAIDPESFYDFQATRPLIDLSTASGSSIIWPEVELLVARSPDGPHDVLLVAGAEPSMRWRTFCTLLLDAAASLGVTRVVTLGSLLADVVHSHPVRLTGMASDPAFIAGMGFREPSYAGPTGIIGVLHHEASARGMETVSGSPTPRGASPWCGPSSAWPAWALTSVSWRRPPPPSRVRWPGRWRPSRGFASWWSSSRTRRPT
jgi:proteasome assembly chaperone (PAC2) family protein